MMGRQRRDQRRLLYEFHLDDAVNKATRLLHVLKEKYGDRVGYGIEDEAGHNCQTW